MTAEDAKKRRFFGLYNHAQVRLYGFLLAVVHNSSDADDILQETATTLWDKFDQYQEGTNFGAWAVKIANYKVLEFMRKNKKNRMFFQEDFYEAVSKYAQEDSADISNQMEALRICLDKVPENSKKLLTMRYQRGVSIKQISRLTGRSSNGLYQSFTRIVDAVRKCMNRKIAEWAR